MNSLIVFYNSSIGKKVFMSLTGLFLCTYLIVHLGGNLLLLRDDGGRLFDMYAEFMSSNPIIRTIEVVLFASFLVHILSGLFVWLKNRRSRPEKYEVYKISDTVPLASRNTMLTGSIVFIFLVIHLRDFWVPTRFGTEAHSMYQTVRQAFQSPLYDVFYVVAVVLLAYHLRHGFQSAFQTLGLRGKRYEGFLDLVAMIFWLVIPLGFAAIPTYIYFFGTLGPSAIVMGAH